MAFIQCGVQNGELWINTDHVLVITKSQRGEYQLLTAKGQAYTVDRGSHDRLERLLNEDGQ
ncbi:hypothetical protein FHU33_4089 [Blastococcus colisei]|uniref:Uncharacterized protein n=2 Tax=Blastococcus TaxID=38501 RepID=A0A543P021_9ACTN|nr:MULTISPECIES: hypothetical protein [Blastococcus]MDT0276264.1 hypothetical protein [Blastococcus sp. DSM 46792]TQN37437.1 hypothetical protein FHU33_4089 [Blastococcus colisei]